MMNLKPYWTNLWILANPVIVYRTLRGFFRALVLGKNTLKTIEVFPTFECQLRCQMCSVEKFKGANQEPLAEEDYESIAREGAKLGAIAMTLLGGEPLVSRDVDKIIRSFKSNHYFVTMVSNSIGITTERVKRLRAAGLDSIYFSLESMEEDINDAIRGTGHYRKVMDAIGICKEVGLMVGLAGVILPGRLDDYIRLLEYCRENDLLASGGEVAAVGAAEYAQLLSEEEHRQVLSLLKKYPRLTFDWALSYFLKVRCPAGKEKIGITCYGDVIGCSLNPISFGNIREEGLEKIWTRMGRFSQFQKDSERCLTAGDNYYISEYIVPTAKSDTNPISFRKHPAIRPDREPELLADSRGALSKKDTSP